MLTAMIQAYKSKNENTRLDVLPLADSSDVARAKAKRDIVVTGTASEDSTINIYINDYLYSVAILKDDTADDIASAINTAINAVSTTQWTSTVLTDTVTVEYIHYGTVGNKNLGVKIANDIPGVTFAIGAIVDGSKDPIFDLEALVKDERYNTIIFPYEYGFDEVADLLEPRINTSADIINDGVGVCCIVDTIANQISLYGKNLNKKSILQIGAILIDETKYKGSIYLKCNYVVSSLVGALRELRLTDGTDLNGIVQAGDRPEDLIGGASICSKPYFNTIIDDTILDVDYTLLKTEVDSLENAQVSLLVNDDAKLNLVFNSFFTTYGDPKEPIFKYLNIIDEISISNEFIFNNLKASFGQTRLVSGLARAGAIDRTKVIAKMDELFEILCGDDYYACDLADKEIFTNSIEVSVDKLERTTTITCTLPLVSQAEKFYVNLRFSI